MLSSRKNLYGTAAFLAMQTRPEKPLFLGTGRSFVLGLWHEGYWYRRELYHKEQIGIVADTVFTKQTWRKADMLNASANVCFQGKADLVIPPADLWIYARGLTAAQAARILAMKRSSSSRSLALSAERICAEFCTSLEADPV